jgi:hypothetical protein
MLSIYFRRLREAARDCLDVMTCVVHLVLPALALTALTALAAAAGALVLTDGNPAAAIRLLNRP